MTNDTGLVIAVIGAGLIGRQHVARALANPRVRHVVVVDPYVKDLPADLAGAHLVPATDFSYVGIDGVIIATPNAAHECGALGAIAAGVPVLVEKPLADTEAAALAIVAASDTAGVPVLVGHHRRYSATLRAARAAVRSFGPLVAISGSALFAKPAQYFADAPWRTEAGSGGPLLINLVHDLDALRFLAGDVARVRCVASRSARQLDVEDTAALILEFENGALGTFVLSDCAASHASWEQTAGENAAYDRNEQEDCYHLAGRRGSLSVPTLRTSRAVDEPSWWSPTQRETISVEQVDPLVVQLDHFCDVIEKKAAPLVSARDGLQALRMVLAAAKSANLGGEAVAVSPPPAETATMVE